ncbi:SH3 domain-containing protein [Peribacillus glennii]|uniref:SH3 domain-containing protein n=2 Tax=Peribacillus glennii TaxID=2303991 RepID=A0A372LED4_9BACI|nr:SH3 domain-containing protein [Peribacillus glennii]
MASCNKLLLSDAASVQMKVNVDSLNVRFKPGTQYSRIESLKKNQVVTVYEKQSTWSKIAFGKTYGWVSSS